MRRRWKVGHFYYVTGKGYGAGGVRSLNNATMIWLGMVAVILVVFAVVKLRKKG
jgi:hypothetical protein